MHFVGTRGGFRRSSFADVLLGALAPDRGLAMPEIWPVLSLPAAQTDHAAIACELIGRFAESALGSAEVAELVSASLATFAQPDITPLVELESGLYLLELFHGPTLAFKDIALQLLARLMTRELKRQNRRATILVATSGDTGSAAIAAFGGLPRVELFVLHPRGRVSEVQRRQMTNSPHANVHNIALEGSFDDAQALVKTLFSDGEFSKERSLVAVNSINLVRILAQAVYYFTSTAKLGRPARFVVPTGNFGDVFAGEAAARMGLPVAGLVAATNANDILARTLETGIYAPQAAQATLSPSMDIQIASNFERALFEASGRDGSWVSQAMEKLARERSLTIPADVLATLRSRYQGESVDDRETLDTIAGVFRRHGRLIDPHTAVALAAARRRANWDGAPTVVLATADPAKFPETVAQATGTVAPLPPRLRHSYVGKERLTVLPPEVGTLRNFIEARTLPHER